MIRIKGRCLFDITATGVTGHFKSSRVPFQDRAGQSIVNDITWNRSRNQQRNWETIMQLISLRTQIIDVKEPQKNNGIWEFEFGTETADVYGTAEDPTAILRADCAGVPMIVNLDHNQIMASELVVEGHDQNIWFDTLTINNELGN